MDITEEILRLKKEKDAVILAHYYVTPEVQALADCIGDSFYLSKLASSLENRTIVYCGVSFMGESGCLLNPGKDVLMPDAHADCPMAHMVKKSEIDSARAQWPDLAVVCYINSTAEIKSWSDVCVTSANAVKIVKALPNRNVLFIPDRNLGRHVAAMCPEKNVMTVSGYCPIHEGIDPAEIEELSALHPEAKILVHPECRREVTEQADYIGSTSGMIKFATESEAAEFIVATEIGVEYELRRLNPQKRFFFPKTLPVCADMKLITPEKILHVLKTGENRAGVSVSHASAARNTLSKMLELAK